jgi:hypothetical protein
LFAPYCFDIWAGLGYAVVTYNCLFCIFGIE